MIISNSGFGAEEFTVRIDSHDDKVSVKIGDVTAPFTIPFSRDEIELALDDFSPNRVSTDPLTSVGSALFSTLFAGPLGRMLWQRIGEVERDNRGLRLRILSSAERTQHLPWELLFDPSRGDFMSLSGRLALVRTRQENFAETSLPALSTLRILAAEADRNGLMRTSEDIDILERFASELPDRIQLTTIRGATPGAVLQHLDSGEYDVFHFAGTGEVLPQISRKGGVRQALQLLHNAGSDGMLDRQVLGRMLRKAGVRLAVFNACHSDWIARSVARYVPAVIGFRESVLVESCLTLCDTLYRSLNAGIPLDLAITAARQTLNLNARPGTADWCKLIFYLQQPDGTFLDPVNVAAAPSRASSAAIPDNKEIAKLTRLLDVHERNLAALTRSPASSAPSAYPDEQVASLRGKIDHVKQQLSALTGGLVGGDGGP